MAEATHINTAADDRIFPVPEFAMPFAAAQAIADIADGLIEEHEKELGHLSNFAIDYLWKKKGGKSLSKPNYSGRMITGNLLRHYSDKTFIVWIAADHCEEAKLSARQVEALVFSELLRLGEDPKRGGPRLIAPDFQGFTAELETYGTWNKQLRSMGALLTQLGIDFNDPQPTTEDEGDEETGEPTPIR